MTNAQIKSWLADLTAKNFPSDTHCLRCRSCNCPYNRECVHCGQSFTFYCKGADDGNTNNWLTVSILDEWSPVACPVVSIPPHFNCEDL